MASSLLLFVLTLVLIQPGSIFAAETIQTIQAKSYIVMDYDSGEILREKNEEEPRPPASMTKMMVMFVILDKIKAGELSWNDRVTVSKRAAEVHEASINLLPGEKMTVRELFIAMTVQSANDAAVALAEHVAGSEEAFVQLMNEKAKSLGMIHTHYRCATGLDMKFYSDPPKVGGEHVMSAQDTAILATKLLKTHPEILEFTSMIKYQFRKGTARQYNVINWNWMLPGLKHKYNGVDGMKTGHTGAAGYCFTGTAKRNDFRIVTVVMGTQSNDKRFIETAKLMDYSYNNFEITTLVSRGKGISHYEQLPLPNGVERTVPIVAKDEIKLPIHKGERDKYKIQVTFRPHLKAPLAAGAVVGTAKVFYGNQEVKGIATTDVVTSVNIKEASWIQLFFRKAWDEVNNWLK
jgi:D-alanyl-D-alanine carboxypeptidase (penicillin-binding protein 5/6)